MQGQDEALRGVNFTRPPSSAALLKQMPGYGSFDERTEYLRRIKPGTGCQDAPRASPMKLAQ
eukprot:903242-Pyramimonas_sp.AAC.1